MSLANRLEDEVNNFISNPNPETLSSVTALLSEYLEKTRDLPLTLIKPGGAQNEFFTIARALPEYDLVMINNKPLQTVWKIVERSTGKFNGMWLFLDLTPDQSVYGAIYDSHWSIDEMCPDAHLMMNDRELERWEYRTSKLDSQLVDVKHFLTLELL